MRWVKKELDTDEVRELSKKYNLNLIIASILSRRGVVSEDEVRYFLLNDLSSLHNPFLFEEMEDAVDRINTAIEVGESIGIFGDRDVDGITSTVLLYETLTELGAKVSWFLPEGDDNYGLTEEVIEDISKREIGLLITVDCGISNVYEIDMANQKGIDTIIVDHHNPSDTLPEALSIINPKLKDTAYPFKELSGCGVVSKLVWALYFSRTPFYGETLCLMNIRPANDSYVVEAVKLTNLVETERLIDNFIPGMLKYENSRLPGFLEGYETLVYGIEKQRDFLKRIFGYLPDMELSDIEPYVRRFLPGFSGKTLLRIKELEPRLFFGSNRTEEIDVLEHIFLSLFFKREEKVFEKFKERLDIVALGTVADLMPLVNENRILVKVGMEQLSRSKRSGLKELFLRKSLLGKNLKTMDIAWQISPFINSAGRMGEPGRATELLLATDETAVSQLVDYISDLNRKRKGLGSDAWERVRQQARESYEKTGAKFVLVFDPDIHRGVTGIIASRLVNAFGVPSVVMTELKERIVGSLRSTDVFSIRDFLENFSDLLENYGGHDFAAGFSMPKSNLEDFKEKFFDLIDTIDVPEKERDIIQIDAEIPPKYLTPEIVKVVDFFEPFGEKNPPLIFLTRGIVLSNVELIGKRELNHLRLLFDTGRYKWPAVYWNGAGAAERVKKGDKVDIVYRITRNFFQNVEKLQLNVLDMKGQ